MAGCVVLVPVLRRPHRVTPLIESFEKSEADARLLFICSPGDTAEQDAIAASGADYTVLDREAGPGDYARKINHGYRTTDEPLLFLAADDLDFHPGWFQAATAKLAPGVGVVGTNDLGNPRVLRGIHSTHSLVTRDYADLGTIDEPGKVLHEGYWHEYCDDEMVETSWFRKAWAFAADAIVEHLHPNWKPEVPSDELYEMQNRRMRQGKRLFIRRRPLWCPNGGP